MSNRSKEIQNNLDRIKILEFLKGDIKHYNVSKVYSNLKIDRSHFFDIVQLLTKEQEIIFNGRTIRIAPGGMTAVLTPI